MPAANALALHNARHAPSRVSARSKCAPALHRARRPASRPLRPTPPKAGFFEDQEEDDFLSPATAVTTSPDAWTSGAYAQLDEKIVMFGVSHLEEGAFDAAEYILSRKPALVVVETAVTSEHGDATGNVCNFEQGVSAMMVDAENAPEALVFVTRLAGALKGELEPIAESPQWESMKAQLPPEVLVYAAAFAVGASVVYGDRPKAVTYRRLMASPTLAELDSTFAKQSERNYRLLLPNDHPIASKANERTHDCFERIIIDERDTVLASTIRECADKVEEGQKVVAVVGVDHVEGISRIIGDKVEDQTAYEQAMKTPGGTPDALGVRIALTQRLMGLRCAPALVDDVMRTLNPDVGSLQGQDATDFELVSEVYSSARMLMACVEDKEVLDAVIGGFKCDFSEDVLAPIRAVRPCNGGKGYSDEIIDSLRTSSVVDFSRKS